jgi:hypothetical protein
MSLPSKPLRVVLLWVAFGAVGLVLSACSRVEDRRSGSGVCEVHNVKMQTEVVYPCNKLISWKAGYVKDKLKLFPNCTAYGPPFDYDYEGQPFKVYVCPACVRAQDDYTKNRNAR